MVWSISLLYFYELKKILWRTLQYVNITYLINWNVLWSIKRVLAASPAHETNLRAWHWLEKVVKPYDMLAYLGFENQCKSNSPVCSMPSFAVHCLLGWLRLATILIRLGFNTRIFIAPYLCDHPTPRTSPHSLNEIMISWLVSASPNDIDDSITSALAGMPINWAALHAQLGDWWSMGSRTAGQRGSWHGKRLTEPGLDAWLTDDDAGGWRLMGALTHFLHH